MALSRRNKKRAFIAAGALAAALTLGGGMVVAADAVRASYPPPVSEQVQQYYNENVANAKVTPPPTAAPAPVVAFLGDSYTVGARATSTAKRWSTIVSEDFGWAEKNFGIADSGYFVAGSMANGEPYHARVKAVAAAKPSIVVVSGGRNDLYEDQAKIDPAIRKTFTDLRAALPKARIVAVSPFWGASEPIPPQLSAIAGTVRASVESVGGRYVDVGQPILRHPEMMHSDLVHPLDAGYAALARSFIINYKP